MSDNDFEYFEGTKTIQHEDGSTTYVTTCHEPYVEPLTPKQQAAVIGATVAAIVGVIALPFGLERLEEWSHYRKERREIRREKKLAEEKAAPTENS